MNFPCDLFEQEYQQCESNYILCTDWTVEDGQVVMSGYFYKIPRWKLEEYFRDESNEVKK